jgi:prefoldin subunit 5
MPKVEHVCLWLGANVMMEFTFEEAEKLLTKNLKTATENLGVVEQQLSFLRDQITTSEVCSSRPETLHFEVVQTSLLVSPR